MSSAATRHAERARRASAFVHQTMRERGMSCMRNDLDTALLELTPVQLEQVHASATALAKGGDRREDMALLAAVRTGCAQATRSALSGVGAIYRADVLLPLASNTATAPAFMRELARLRRADLPQAEREQAAAQLRAMCGPLDHSDLLGGGAAPGEDAAAATHESTLERQPQLHSGALAEQQPSQGKDQPPLQVLSKEDETGGRHAARRKARPASAGRAQRQSLKIYGKAGALTIEAAPVRATAGDVSTASTVMIEGAAARGDGTFDWSVKIVFACALRELPQLLAVLLGWHDVAEFKFHGGRADKNLLLQHQEHGLFVKLRDAAQAVAVPVVDADRYAFAMLVLGVMAENDACGDRQAVLAVCRAVMACSPRTVTQA